MKELPVLNWSALSREPIVRALLLSACLHLALTALIQPTPGSGSARTVVINARLETVTPPSQAEAPTPTETAAPPVAQAPEARQPAILASDQASPNTLPVPVTAPAVAEAKTPPVATAAAPPSTNPPIAGTTTPNVGPAASTTLPNAPVGIDTTWYQARQVDSQPRVLTPVDPRYPEQAHRRNLEGTLKLMLKIDDLGRVQSAEVVEANPPGIFEETVLEAFRKARFQPAMKDGRPVRVQAYYRVDFKLED